MKRNFSRALLSALCAFALLLGMVPAASAAGTPAESDNYMDNYYGGNNYHSSTVNSYLYQNSSGGLTRVEYISEGKKIVVEDYSSDFQLQNSRTISFELSVWGGFYAGSQYNYLIFGQNNPSYSNSVEVFRIVKYSKDWQRLGQASVYGANTYQPFHAGSLRCAESGGYLYVHTCHTMYPSSDGKNHQANVTLVVRESDMTVTDTYCTISFLEGYVSHSFNQFIMVDSLGNILTADHGDGYPRAMIMYKFDGKAGTGSIDTNAYQSDMAFVQSEKFFGQRGQNLTDAQLGGIAETSSGYLMAYTMGDNKNLRSAQQIHLSYISKNNFRGYFIDSEGWQTCNNSFQDKVLTSYTTSFWGATAPYLVSTGLNGGWIMWNESCSDSTSMTGYNSKGFSYAPYNADGSIGTVKTLSGTDVVLSDCQPIVYNGKVVWYTTHNSAPVFYTLDASGVQSHPANGSGTSNTPSTPSTPADSVTSPFSDVKASDWFYPTVMTLYSKSIVSGKSDGRFDPNGKVTWGEALKLVMEACGYSAKSGTGAGWAEGYKAVAVDRGWVDDSVSLTAAISTNEIAELICRVLDITPAGRTSPYADTANSYGIELYYTSPQIFIGSANPDGGKPLFNGDKDLTRAQVCAVIVRVMNLVNDNVLPS